MLKNKYKIKGYDIYLTNEDPEKYEVFKQKKYLGYISIIDNIFWVVLEDVKREDTTISVVSYTSKLTSEQRFEDLERRHYLNLAIDYIKKDEERENANS